MSWCAFCQMPHTSSSCYHPGNPANRGTYGASTSIDEIRKRHAAFMHHYRLSGGHKTQEVDDIGVLIAEIDRLRLEAKS